jgi:hypothetical protein
MGDESIPEDKRWLELMAEVDGVLITIYKNMPKWLSHYVNRFAEISAEINDLEKNRCFSRGLVLGVVGMKEFYKKGGILFDDVDGPVAR